jgi:hypothetical protein
LATPTITTNGGSMNINLVYSIGRVGSTSIYKSLAQHGYRNLYQVHFINPNRWDLARPDSRGQKPKHLRSAIAVYNTMKTKGHQYNIICGVREPVRRTLSSAYHNNINTALLTEDDFIHSVTFFEKELYPMFGINIYKKKFDKQLGYSIYEYPNHRIRLLLYRQENLKQRKTQMLNKFYGKRHKRIRNWNVSQSEVYLTSTALYKCQYVDMLYDMPMVKHFYTEDEIEDFRERWK